MICSDLISTKDISKVKIGLKKLILNYLSDDYLTNSIDEEVNKLDCLVYRPAISYPSIKIGRYSFHNSNPLNSKISYFTIYFRSVNASYFCVEFHVFFSDIYKSDLSSFCERNYSIPHAFVQKVFSPFDTNPKRREHSSILYYPNEQLKSDFLYEKFCSLKWEFFEFVQDFFQTFLHSSNIIPLSVVFYGTNINYNDLYCRDFWSSVGVNQRSGETFTHHGNPFEYGRLFFQTSLSDRYNYCDKTSLIYIINTERKQLKFGFQDLEDQIDFEFTDAIASSLFLLLFLSISNNAAQKIISYYRERFNKIKLNTHSLKKVLLLRFNFEKDIVSHESIISQPSKWSIAQLDFQRIFFHREVSFRSASYSLSTLTLSEKDSLISQISELKSEFDQKVEILEHLVSYKRESKNLRFAWFSAIIASITLYFLIYPDRTEPVALFINNLIKLITAFIFKEV